MNKIYTANRKCLTLVLALVGWVSLAGNVHAQKRATAAPAGEVPSLVQSSTFSNSTAIAISDATVASPYASSITVSGVTGLLRSDASGVSVTINGFSHSFPDDVALVLVAPNGAALEIQDGAGDDPDVANVTYTLSDAGAGFLPDTTAWAAGTYKPTSYLAGDIFPAPGPGITYNTPGPVVGGTATFASTFGNINPNGVWNLYVVDLTNGDIGSISGGWSLILTPLGSTAASVTVSGRVVNGSGVGIRGATVMITDSRGNKQISITNAFGNYSFAGVQSGETYIANATARGITFASRVVTVNDAVANLDFSPQ